MAMSTKLKFIVLAICVVLLAIGIGIGYGIGKSSHVVKEAENLQTTTDQIKGPMLKVVKC